MSNLQLPRTLELPTLRPDQYNILTHPEKPDARIIVAAIGRRWGKSYMLSISASTTAIAGGQVAIIIPTYANGTTFWQWFNKFLAPLKASKQVTMNKGEQVIYFPETQGSIRLITSENPTNARGLFLDLCLVDEAARLVGDAQTIFWDVLMPTLADTDGTMILASSVNGQNWFFDLYQMAKNDTSGRMAAYTAKTIENPSPAIKKHVAEQKLMMPSRRFQQEYESVFLDSADGIFSGIKEVATAEQQLIAIDGHSYIIACDIARSNDFTCYAVLDVDLNAIVFIDHFTGIPYSQQLDRLSLLNRRFQPDTNMIEKNSAGQPFIDQCIERNMKVVPYLQTQASKNQIINALSLAIEMQEISYIPDEQLLRELASYKGVPSASGLMKYGAPHGMTDDVVQAVAMAWHSKSTQRKPLTVTTSRWA